MDISKMLDYQKLDSELFKLEKSLRDSQHKAQASQMQDTAKKAQERSSQLESKAEALYGEIDKMRSQYAVQQKKMEEIFAKNVDSLSKEEVESLLSVKDKLASNLAILDKNLTRLAESVNAVLADFNKTVKVYNMARETYAKSKGAYDAQLQEVEPKRKQITEKLQEIAKTIDPKLMEQYTKRRKDNIFPVMVPVRDSSCGGCHMELPVSMMNKLKEEGVLSCEHCRRIIYNI